jgi:hypothetical protein
MKRPVGDQASGCGGRAARVRGPAGAPTGRGADRMVWLRGDDRVRSSCFVFGTGSLASRVCCDLSRHRKPTGA